MELGKLLIAVGAIFLVAGVIVLMAGRALPLGRLPGDMVVRGKHTVFYFPLATSILLSILLSLILYIIGRFTR